MQQKVLQGSLGFRAAFRSFIKASLAHFGSPLFSACSTMSLLSFLADRILLKPFLVLDCKLLEFRGLSLLYLLLLA